ncbi:MAG TPA: hypothetical protein VKB68_04085, partial [Stellaceae bacterium]|nr:hypothetical protein [Stellaceae bacterium]
RAQRTDLPGLAMSRFPRLTQRVDEARSPANNLALVMAFSGVGLISTFMQTMVAGLAYVLRLLP